MAARQTAIDVLLTQLVMQINPTNYINPFKYRMSGWSIYRIYEFEHSGILDHRIYTLSISDKILGMSGEPFNSSMLLLDKPI